MKPRDHCLEQFHEIPIFSAHIWALRHAGSRHLETPPPPITAQLLTPNQNLQNISADIFCDIVPFGTKFPCKLLSRYVNIPLL